MYCELGNHETDHCVELRTGEKCCFKCSDLHYRALKRQRKEQGQERIQPLYSTPQFLIDFEVYNRFLSADNADIEDAQAPGNLRFTYQGADYILWELALRSTDPDAEAGSDCFYTEMCCGLTENVLVDQQDFEWRVICWKGDAESNDPAHEELLLAYDDPFPHQLLELAREKWTVLNKYDQAFLKDLQAQQQ